LSGCKTAEAAAPAVRVTQTSIDIDKVKAAAEWLAVMPREQRKRAAVPLLRQKFNLTATEAIAAIRESVVIQGRAS
jgi:hypothetical protein